MMNSAPFALFVNRWECTWLTALFPQFFDLRVCLMRGLLCRDLWLAEPGGRWSLAPVMLMRRREPTWLLNSQSLLGQWVWTAENCLCVHWKRSCDVSEESGDSSRLNRVWSLFCLEKKQIITKLVRNQMVGQIFDKFWEIKSAKRCWHLASRQWMVLDLVK